MYQKAIRTRNAIIGVTISLLLTKKPGQITIREIARASGIGIGLINYHFGSKDELLLIAIEAFISKTMMVSLEELKKQQMEPAELLKRALIVYADFLASYPRLCRLWLVSVIGWGKSNKLLLAGYQFYLPILDMACPNRDREYRICLLTQLISSIHSIFLLSGEPKTALHPRFEDRAWRCRFIEQMFATVRL